MDKKKRYPNLELKYSTPVPFVTLSFLRCSATTSLRVVRVLYLRGTRVHWLDSLRFLHKLGKTSG
jgi:hypothetical protein